MAVTARQIPRRPVEQVTATPESAVLDQLGGPVELSGLRFPAEDRGPMWMLALELRFHCGSIDRNCVSGYEVIPNPSGWRTLRECSTRQVAEAVRRTMRIYPDWRLPGTDQQDLHARIDNYFAAARRVTGATR